MKEIFVYYVNNNESIAEKAYISMDSAAAAPFSRHYLYVCWATETNRSPVLQPHSTWIYRKADRGIRDRLTAA